ncbi:MAG: hypothetical protein OXE96_02560 [Gemmatimonadetes bacterium]|nr:hypothetical protein [Gemmatimonadota bacterium]
MAKKKKPRQTSGRKAIFERVRRGTLAFVHVQSKKNGDESKLTVVGSGFPIRDARGMVLTARHVLKPQDSTKTPTHVMMVRRATPNNGAVDYEAKILVLADALNVTTADNMDFAAVEFNHTFPPDSVLTIAKRNGALGGTACGC